MEKIIGRKEEIAVLQKLKNSNKSEFVAVYGRRRVGKTFLIRNVFDEPFRRSQAKSGGVQIDMLIDRNDRVINVCEIKFSTKPFVVTKAYSENLRNKMMTFRVETDT